jgi:regulatory protein
LQAKLLKLGFDRTLIHEVLETLGDQGYQSDVRYTESFVHSRARRGVGPERIRRELTQRGVESGQESALSEVNWRQELDRIYAKKYGAALLPHSTSERAKRERFLKQRGFSFEDIAQLFRRLSRGDFGGDG